MDKTILTLNLGGNDVTLKFNIGTLRKLKTIMGKDPLQALTQVDTFGAIDFAEHVVHAGMLSNDPKADVSKVTEWMDSTMPDTATKIITAFTSAYTSDTASPEGGKDTQPG